MSFGFVRVELLLRAPGRLSSLINTNMFSRGGKMSARALLATAPIREMRSPRSGRARANEAVWVVNNNFQGYKIVVINSVQIFTAVTTIAI